MGWIVTTRSHNGRTLYLRLRGGSTTDRGKAWRYATERGAENALVKRRLESDVDSIWHHATIEEAAIEYIAGPLQRQ